MRWLALLLLAGCAPKPEPPTYFIQKTVTEPDGTVTVWTYASPRPPPQWEIPLLTED